MSKRKSVKSAKKKQKLKVVDVDAGIHDDAASSEAPEAHEEHTETHQEEIPESKASSDPKLEIRFAGSEYLRAQFPKSFEIAETVATDWMNNGNFEGLPIENPLAQFVASKGLQKAKEVEKKVLESPVTEKIAMKAFEVGLKAQSQIQEIKRKLKKND